MFLSFSLTKKGDLFFIRPGRGHIWGSAPHPDYPYSIELPEKIPLNDGSFQNLPIYSVNLDKYEAGENPLETFDPYTYEPFLDGFRREEISNMIRANITMEAELKTLRKTMGRIIEIIQDEVATDVIKDPQVEKFFSVYGLIEGQISRNKKAEVKSRYAPKMQKIKAGVDAQKRKEEEKANAKNNRKVLTPGSPEGTDTEIPDNGGTDKKQ